MANGLQCFDAGGNLTFNSADYLGKFLGSTAVSTTNGSYTATGASSLGTLFFIWVSNGDGTLGFAAGCPSITSSGDVISWDYGTWGGTSRNSGTIFYGVR